MIQEPDLTVTLDNLGIERAPAEAIEYFHTFCRIAGVQLVLLHGSFAKGRAALESDVDVVYMGIDPLFPGLNMDLVDLRKASPLLAWNVAQYGITLFGSRQSRLDFNRRALWAYDDVRRFEKFNLREVDEFLAECGLR